MGGSDLCEVLLGSARSKSISGKEGGKAKCVFNPLQLRDAERRNESRQEERDVGGKGLVCSTGVGNLLFPKPSQTLVFVHLGPTVPQINPGQVCWCCIAGSQHTNTTCAAAKQGETGRTAPCQDLQPGKGYSSRLGQAPSQGREWEGGKRSSFQAARSPRGCWKGMWASWGLCDAAGSVKATFRKVNGS